MDAHFFKRNAGHPPDPLSEQMAAKPGSQWCLPSLEKMVL